MNRTMIRWGALILAAASIPGQAADPREENEGVTWLVRHQGAILPGAPWKAVGTVNAALQNGALHLVDDSTGSGHYRAEWEPRPGHEIIVEARVKVGATTGSRKSKSAASLWPWRDGAPVSLLVSDGIHQEGLVLAASQAATHTDRFIPMDTTDRFHTYRLVIRGTDMALWVDGVRRVRGQGAFWKPADAPQPFIRFGSSAATATGDAHWASVRLGVRKPDVPPGPDPLDITMSDPWEIPRADVRQTRPYLNDAGRGLLLLSVAQGPDAFYEPYGLLRSTDEGKTWTPVAGLDKIDATPLPALHRPDGSILAASRWTWTDPDGSIRGKTTRLDARATTFSMIDSRITLPERYANAAPGDHVICERHIWNDTDGRSVTMVVWSRKQVRLPDGRAATERMSHLVRTTDEGATWNYVSTIGPGGEPAVARLSPTELTAVIRGTRTSQMTQVFSHDDGRTWSDPIALEEGKVAPDLVAMSNGVLACSYGRPASCIMFSVDGGRTWCAHRVVSERVGFNYTSIREIRPGRLLYLHDAPVLTALTIDVRHRPRTAPHPARPTPAPGKP